ncbi:glycosyltransferase family 2 protein [Microbacterium invictum]|uniref:Glycosyltransferase involved in cell wall biosynthesis n=1 Tax=Microbacterium invictum TaxID=515415 RepID=A0AA40VMS8_9MICO|nr:MULTISPECIES: glycosyltransferase family A protein [Microbacterium]MBB4139623.1 glycosyltransferase involved in cell wall biosynthesis [Microbacterium invictum]
MAQPHTPWVSIVVPVFDPGPWIRPLLDSFDAQTLPHEDMEVLLVDDGSTDGTERLLDRWTADRAWARVIHQPPSGWPSRPRNTGLSQARGEYVYLVDHDDWLAPDALQQLRDFARGTGPDVVVGRMAGMGRKVPKVLFRSTVTDAHSPAQPLQDSMTTHALFRREFLDEIGLRFDEELRRLEDHLFMAHAYTEARQVAVYGDSTVYIHAERDDGEGAGYRRYRANEYYPALRRCIDTMVEALPAGPERDAYLTRWIRIELVGRLQSDAVRWLPRDERDAFFANVQQVLAEHVPADAAASLSPAWRWPGALARTVSADEFYRAEDAMTTALRAQVADRPGSAVLRDVLSQAALERAITALGEDEPLPAGRAASDTRQASRRRLRLRAMGLVSRFPGGGLHRVMVTWGRTPRLLARRVAAVGTVIAPVVAAVLVGLPVWSLIVTAAGLALTTWLALRSLRGWPTAARQALALLPGVVAVVAAPAGGTVAATVVAGTAIVAALFIDARWRRTDVRAHASRTGGPFARLGWIALTAAGVSALVLAADAWALLA